MSAATLHVAGPVSADGGNDCSRCGAVLGGPDARFMPVTLVAMPDGYYKSARMATLYDLRTGVLCEARPAEVTVRVGTNVVMIAPQSDGIFIGLKAIQSGMATTTPMIASVPEALALADALRQAIDSLDAPRMVRFADRLAQDRRATDPRPTETGSEAR